MTRRIAMAWALSALLAACGGSSSPTTNPGDAGPAATPAAVSGAVTGVGSNLTVDGVAYDVSGSTVTDDTDPANPQPASLTDLQLGQQVDLTLHPSGKPARVAIHATLVGPVDEGSIDATGAFTVLGQAVTFAATGDAATRFVGVKDASELAAGRLVVVHGALDAKGAVAARLVVVMPEGAPLVSRIRGVVSASDAAAKTFKLGALTVSYEGAKLLPAGAAIEDGEEVVVFSRQKAIGTAPALTLAADAVRLLHPVKPAIEVRLGGPITAVTPVDGQAVPNLELGALKVDSSKAELEDGTTAAALVVGAVVRVEGTLAGGVLAASEIAVVPLEVRKHVVLAGQVSSFTSLSSFVVRGTTVDGSKAKFAPGSSAEQLADGVCVLILGQVSSSGVVADEITVVPPPPAIELQLVGAVSKYDATARTFELVGMKMKLDPQATFEGGAAADLADGKLIEVKGSFDGTVFTVKAVEFVDLCKGRAVAPGCNGEEPKDPRAKYPHHVSGVVSGVTPATGAPTSFVLNNVTIAVASSTKLEGTLKDGVRAWALIEEDASGAQVALEVHVISDQPTHDPNDPNDPIANMTHFTGAVSEVTSATLIKVDGQVVDVSKAEFLPKGKAAKDLAVGQHVVVGGPMSDNVVTATVIQILK